MQLSCVDAAGATPEAVQVTLLPLQLQAWSAIKFGAGFPAAGSRARPVMYTLDDWPASSRSLLAHSSLLAQPSCLLISLASPLQLPVEAGLGQQHGRVTHFYHA